VKILFFSGGNLTWRWRPLSLPLPHARKRQTSPLRQTSSFSCALPPLSSSIKNFFFPAGSQFTAFRSIAAPSLLSIDLSFGTHDRSHQDGPTRYIDLFLSSPDFLSPSLDFRPALCSSSRPASSLAGDRHRYSFFSFEDFPVPLPRVAVPFSYLAVFWSSFVESSGYSFQNFSRMRVFLPFLFPPMTPLPPVSVKKGVRGHFPLTVVL